MQTFFICVALAVGAISFSKDADHLLLAPLERILVKLEAGFALLTSVKYLTSSFPSSAEFPQNHCSQAIRKNPLHAMKLGDIEYRQLATNLQTILNDGNFLHFHINSLNISRCISMKCTWYREQELEEEGNGEKLLSCKRLLLRPYQRGISGYFMIFPDSTPRRFCCNKRRDKSSELETLETAILERRGQRGLPGSSMVLLRRYAQYHCVILIHIVS